MSANSAYLVTERTQLLDGPLGAILLLESERADGQFAFVEHTLAPRALGAPVHSHGNEDEYSLVVEGTIGVEIGDEVLEATTGRIVLKPRGIPHAFWNATDRPARFLEPRSTVSTSARPRDRSRRVFTPSRYAREGVKNFAKPAASVG